MAMALKEEDLQIIGKYVQSHLTEWLPEQPHAPSSFTYPIELTERMVRVEEELKNQRELMLLGFEQMDKRFDQMQHNMDKRFEQVDKRFEQVDKHFDQVNSRLESMQARMFHFMIWSSGFAATVAGIVIAVIKFT